MRKRTDTRKVMVGDVQIGGQNRVVLQTMTLGRTKAIDETVQEINRYATSGADLVRLAVLDMEDASAIKYIKAQTSVPLVADIHFDHRLALKAIASGIDKIRINPGNIKREADVKAVAYACKDAGIPIRIGVNAGSLPARIEAFHGRTATAMVESAKQHVSQLEAHGFEDIVISLKASDVRLAVESYMLAADTFSYPLHIGITEAGSKERGSIISAAGLGTLLYHGIGDTIRISLHAPRHEELDVAKTLLSAYGLYTMPTVIACPTCGRLSYDMGPLLAKVEAYLQNHPKPLKVAVMGCAVNGPGEARDADIGVAGGHGEGLIFIRGKIIKKVPQEKLFEALVEAIDNFK
ncbi:MAG: flavodoxin-dependent (E)-4-hydroxy-3-methylbut-2-enyl-diphosphate synthase [Acholeplasmatales bacterium]|nr:MAG: flavodoxin-dependent (E)-4-hydroxy-3-methylbut-2-enyl-diphosphate synthase [Acholeplasmatales bacterium]